MLKQPARFTSLALLMFAASAAPLTAKATQFDGPTPYPPIPPAITAMATQFDGPTPYPPIPPAVTAKATQFDGPTPYPPIPPASCMPAPSRLGVVG